MKKNHYPMLCLAIYIICSLYASFWISDDFDELRVFLYAYIGIPLATIFFFLYFYNYTYFKKKQKTYFYLHVFFYFIFSWGQILFLNAVSSSHNIKVAKVLQTDEKKKSITVSRLRGGLGLIYRTRW